LVWWRYKDNETEASPPVEESTALVSGDAIHVSIYNHFTTAYPTLHNTRLRYICTRDGYIVGYI